MHRRASRLGYSSFSSAFSAALFSLLMPAAMETVNRGWVRVFKIYTGMRKARIERTTRREKSI